MEFEEGQIVNTNLKKTPSEPSCASVELYIPRRRGESGSNVGPGVIIDKECLSMKSDCGMDIRRRFSLVNATGKKVLPDICSFVMYTTKFKNSNIAG